LIGLEREIHGCAAGLRTHILVSIGSALFMLTSLGVGEGLVDPASVDPSRIASGVVTGIGFLGAGAIIRYGSSIRGLTTAASIWAVAAIGLAVGTGMYTASGVTTLVALSILILSRLEERMELKRHGKKLHIIVNPETSMDISDIESIIEAYGGRIKNIVTKKDESGEKKLIKMDLLLSRLYHKDIISEVSSLPDILSVEWK
jgi:putative Mg2+ transporter-C (MgtC) family protein